MGIDFSHCGAHWSYSGFHRFRRKLAQDAGLNDLNRMQGFGGWGGQSRGEVPWDTVTDPLAPLLHHSDCNGTLSPEECASIAPRLREIVEKWPDDLEWGYDRSQGLELARGMEKAARKGKPLKFR